MLITEVIAGLKVFVAQVRVGGATLRTTVQADNIVYARSLLSGMFGQGSVMSIQEASGSANESVKPETSTQLRVDALSQQSAQLRKQAKLVKAQDGLKKAQARVAKAQRGPTTTQ